MAESLSLLCPRSEKSKRSLNISELILIYFKYFYGMGYFLLKEKWTPMLQRWRKWRWASARELLYERKINEKEWRQAFIYLSISLWKLLPPATWERINYAPFYNMTIIKSHEVFLKLDRCHISLLSIMYAFVFHMERKINYFLSKLNLIYCNGYYTKKCMHSNTKIHFHLSD
jgi:hypothetical protein